MRSLLPQTILPAMMLSATIPAVACTGITLRPADGAVVPARTVEWAGSRYESQVVVVPRGYSQQSFTSQGQNGMIFTARHGYTGVSCALPQFIVDGVNEQGLCAELFFFPGSGSYPAYDPSKLDITIGDMQLVPYILGSCATIAEVKEAMTRLRVTPLEPSGQTCHWRFTEPGGAQVIMEITGGEVHFFDSIGVLTNSPGYEWHLTNLRNYVNLFPGAAPSHPFLGLELTPISGGSGMLGLPGDFTSPSRFVRAAFFQYTAREQPTAFRTVCQAFQILNNFDIPIGTAWHLDEPTPDMLTATQFTTAIDLASHTLYYRTGVDSSIRSVVLSDLDLTRISYTVRPVDSRSSQPVEALSF